MSEMISSYYKMGLYTADDLALFVQVNYITQEQADALVAGTIEAIKS
ncbi:MAG: XkdX family protein [Lacticaseibacillus songhuajiangensis]|jgi:hypothetical protein|nr:XkdX family protein [Lacticaseibacillus songhuajiangensis]